MNDRLRTNTTDLCKNILAAFASPFSQKNRLVRLILEKDAETGDETLLAYRVAGREAISEIYQIDLECVSANAFIDCNELNGQGAAVTIRTADGGERIVAGLITASGNEGLDGGLSQYHVRIEPAFALLKLRSNCRVFQNKTVQEIVAVILREHMTNNPGIGRTFRFHNRTNPATKRSLCIQYCETDYAFCTRLLREEGISYYWTFEGGDAPTHTMIWFDDVFHLPANEQETFVFKRMLPGESADTITRWKSTRTVQTGRTTIMSYNYKTAHEEIAHAFSSIKQGKYSDALTTTLEEYDNPGQYYASTQQDFERYAKLRQRYRDMAAQQYQGAGPARTLWPGSWIKLNGHPVHDRQTWEKREFLILSTAWFAQNNLPKELKEGYATLFPDPSPTGHPENDTPYHCTFQAIQYGTPIVPEYNRIEHAKPNAPGSQTAVVVGPPGAEIHTDEYGRVLVQFPWQRKEDHPEGGANKDQGSFTWIRVATPIAGRNWGYQSIPRVGMEVKIDFIDGDIDRPVVAGAVPNALNMPPDFRRKREWQPNITSIGFVSKELQGHRRNELVLDDFTGQIKARLASDHGYTALNLGWIGAMHYHNTTNARGEGAELRSDDAIALRGGKGIFISAWLQQGAWGPQLARAEYLRLQEDAHQQFISQGNYAAQHQAMKIDPQPQEKLKRDIENWENGTNTAPGKTGGGQPVVGITAPAGISCATPVNIVSYAGKHHDVIAQENIQHAAGQQYNVNAGKGISLFSHSEGFKAIAHTGKMMIQAQKEDVVINADQNITFTSSNGKIVGMAAKEITLMTSGGAYIKLSGSDVEIGGPGTFTNKFSDFNFEGAAMAQGELPMFDQGEIVRTPQFLQPTDGDPAEETEYQIDADDSTLKGDTNVEGKTPKLNTNNLKTLAVHFFKRFKKL